MIIETDLKKIFNRLVHKDIAEISLGGSNITIKVFDNATKILFSTPVYMGWNFIPLSVRKCIQHKQPFQQRSILKTSLRIDEGRFEIYLQYIGELEHINNERFKVLAEEFSLEASEWRLFLDENDKNDLVHVKVKI